MLVTMSLVMVPLMVMSLMVMPPVAARPHLSEVLQASSNVIQAALQFFLEMRQALDREIKPLLPLRTAMAPEAGAALPRSASKAGTPSPRSPAKTWTEAMPEEPRREWRSVAQPAPQLSRFEPPGTTGTFPWPESPRTAPEAEAFRWSEPPWPMPEAFWWPKSPWPTPEASSWSEMPRTRTPGTRTMMRTVLPRALAFLPVFLGTLIFLVPTIEMRPVHCFHPSFTIVLDEVVVVMRLTTRMHALAMAKDAMELVEKRVHQRGAFLERCGP